MAIVDDSEALIIATDGGAHLPCGDHGFLLGSAFRRGEQHAVRQFTRQEQAAILVSRGQQLIEAYWGPYVAILVHPGTRIDLVRAPWGELPCYRFDTEDAIFLASDVDLLMACAHYQPAIAWEDITRQLVHGPFHHARTCLQHIEQLPGGERWSVLMHGADQTIHRDCLWSPWTFAGRDRQIVASDEAARLVRETAQACIGARASRFDEILLTLSGGLDSSIVAACLASQQASFTAMTLVSQDAIGDERVYASGVSDALNVPLTTSMRDVCRLDMKKSGARGRPYPCIRGFFVESMRLAGDAADRTGAQAVFNGAGGDNIFCSLQSGAPAADRLLAQGPGLGFLRTVRDISQLAPASIPAVLRDALARAWFGKPAFRHRPRFDLLAPGTVERAGTHPDHPWASFPAGTLPGKAVHVWMLAHFKNYVESFDPRSTLPIVAPLLSQPLVEACLSIPTWMWFAGGRNRVIARDAFTGLLPAEILARRSKGTPSSFIFEIFETHRQTIRDMLTEGHLARQGLIDLPGVLRILDNPAPPRDVSVERILHFVDIEAWAAEWSESRC